MTRRGLRFFSVLAGKLGVVALAMMVTSSAYGEAKRYIVTFKSQATFKAIQKQYESDRLSTESRGFRHQGLRFFNTEAKVTGALNQLGMVVVEAEGAVDLESLREHPAVADIEQEMFIPAPAPAPIATFNWTVLRTGVDDSSVGRPWGIDAVKAPAAWDKAGRGAGARVLVLDTGLDKDHPAIASRFEVGKDFTGRTADDKVPYEFFDDNGHGTHVAGTILADGANGGLIGVAPEAKLLMGRVCGSFGCSSIGIVEGIDWGVAQKVDVISMSLGGPFPSRAGREACARAEAANIVVVAASGNDGVSRVSFPAAYENVIAVGAVNSELVKANFSQWGPQLDIVAPGVDVLSSVPVGSGRASIVRVDFGDGSFVDVKSAGFQGSPLVENAQEFELVFVGLGKSADFAGKDVKGKIALIRRGEIRFSEKAKNAIDAGAKGVIMFNNEPGLINGALTEDGSEVAVPVVMIEQEHGDRLVAAIEAKKTARGSVATVRTSYASFQGTSMATPHVAGVVALIRATNTDLTAAQVREILDQTSTALGPNDENQYGRGLVNAELAVEKALAAQGVVPLLTGTGF